MSDILDMEKINSLPHPLANRDGHFIETICVQTGCVRLDVQGLIDHTTFSELGDITDADGNKHNTDDFWID